MRRVYIEIFGKVQGVSYRFHTLEEARKLGITGFVQNESDGRVTLEAQGSSSQIQQISEWCKTGSPLAQVDRVEVSEIEVISDNSFEIRC